MFSAKRASGGAQPILKTSPGDKLHINTAIVEGSQPPTSGMPKKVLKSFIFVDLEIYNRS